MPIVNTSVLPEQSNIELKIKHRPDRSSETSGTKDLVLPPRLRSLCRVWCHQVNLSKGIGPTTGVGSHPIRRCPHPTPLVSGSECRGRSYSRNGLHGNVQPGQCGSSRVWPCFFPSNRAIRRSVGGGAGSML